MSRLEEIKKAKYGPYMGPIAGEDRKWLIVEAERLRKELDWNIRLANDRLHGNLKRDGEIDSLVKERDELKRMVANRNELASELLEKLEAENAELKEKLGVKT